MWFAAAELDKVSGDVIHFTVSKVSVPVCAVSSPARRSFDAFVCRDVPQDDVVFVELAPAAKAGGPFASQLPMLERLWGNIGMKDW